MENRILKSLATCALYPYLDGRETDGMAHSGLDHPNGAEFPDLVACTVLGVPREVETAFDIGFNFALALAGTIAEDPTHSPDLKPAISEAKAMLAEMLSEKWPAAA